MNHKMVGQFPILGVGENTIEWSGAIQFMEIGQGGDINDYFI